MQDRYPFDAQLVSDCPPVGSVAEPETLVGVKVTALSAPVQSILRPAATTK
jgi:hypothetical protein